MPKARLARELVRRKIAMAVGGSVSETYQPFAVEELTNIPADIGFNPTMVRLLPLTSDTTMIARFLVSISLLCALSCVAQVKVCPPVSFA